MRWALQNLTTKEFLQFLSFNGPLCKPLIPSSLKSALNALITIYRRTLSEARAVRVLLLLFISPSQQALSCSIHHGAEPCRTVRVSLLKESALSAGAPGLAAEECRTLASGNFGARGSPRPHTAAVAPSPGRIPIGLRVLAAGS